MDHDQEMTAMSRLVALGACPQCNDTMASDMLPIGTGAIRSLLDWRYCAECVLWATVCYRGTAPHLLIAQPGMIEQIMGAVAGGMVCPQFVGIEYNQCRSRGHLPAVHLN